MDQIGLLKPDQLPTIAHFIGRERELTELQTLASTTEPHILVVYGRRRIGKTSLLQKAFANRNIIKFEGLEGKDQSIQRENFLEQLSRYANDPAIAKLKFTTWRDIFIYLSRYVAEGVWTIYLEELQWMASYSEDLIVDLKYVWDNYFIKNPDLLLILCGSSPSFLIDKVMMSKALYNRSQRELPLRELSLPEAGQILGSSKSQFEILDAYLTVGGIPEYLKLLNSQSSVYLSLCAHAFVDGGYFVNEADRIFVSNLAKNPSYRKVVEVLAKNSPLTKQEIIKKVGIKSGGTTTEIFEDLEKCRFIGYYSPIGAGIKGRNAKYYINDPYLYFYYSYINPVISNIRNGDYKEKPTTALLHNSYRQWLGYSFERFCLQQRRLIAKRLGFEAVSYKVGPYYHRNTASSAQIDLIFQRADKVLTICEIKYRQTPPGSEIIDQFEKKLAILDEKFKNLSIHKVLISPNGAESSLVNSGYFDEVVTLRDFFI